MRERTLREIEDDEQARYLAQYNDSEERRTSWIWVVLCLLMMVAGGIAVGLFEGWFNADRYEQLPVVVPTADDR